jgi:hypothetical protein
MFQNIIIRMMRHTVIINITEKLLFVDTHFFKKT